MADEIRMTPTTVVLLRRFLEDVGNPLFGFEAVREFKLSSGSVYPTLARLEKAGWIEGHLEDIDPKVELRRQRRYYTMTPKGAVEATRAMDRFTARYQLPSWTSGLRPATGNALSRLVPAWGIGRSALGGAQ
ncbi:PadR family transcriptional regulator [Nocardia bovistercoris]|uniref:Helix-turn-helix transcriptional regulator n=1 Tax=Nocardia bovistercoris TaxID=2785916 RepID=A0A931IIN1_9NOCA|nr:PadR family transcriptional regulator [Nocardia bovistercoris]MBH0780385.1 helix-turn-helix transcriptional regulator [Nocardia bovistercoris]